MLELRGKLGFHKGDALVHAKVVPIRRALLLKTSEPDVGPRDGATGVAVVSEKYLSAVGGIPIGLVRGSNGFLKGDVTN